MGDQRPVGQRAAELIREALERVGLDAIRRGITPHHIRLPSVQTTKEGS
jgi:hypothetical protein